MWIQHRLQHWQKILANLGFGMAQKIWTSTKYFGTCRICRDLSRFFDQVGHQTTNTSIEDKHFFTK